MARYSNCGREINFLKNYIHGCMVEYNFDGASYGFVDCVGSSLKEYCCPENADIG